MKLCQNCKEKPSVNMYTSFCSSKCRTEFSMPTHSIERIMAPEFYALVKPMGNFKKRKCLKCRAPIRTISSRLCSGCNIKNSRYSDKSVYQVQRLEKIDL